MAAELTRQVPAELIEEAIVCLCDAAARVDYTGVVHWADLTSRLREFCGNDPVMADQAIKRFETHMRII